MTSKIIYDKDWKSLEERFEWVRDMNFVPQHKLYHKEGTVAVHTQLVLQELLSVEEFSYLTEWQQEILWVAALLHDVEKRSTSINYGDGVISAKGHAEKGEYTARAVLYKDIPVSFWVREQIASLVGLHGLPLWFIDKKDPCKEIKAASLRVEMRMLKILSEADTRGRRCADFEPLIESLYGFKSLCIKDDCWVKPYLFKNDYVRYNYFNSDIERRDINDVPNFKCKVILISGLPRIGKDTYIKEYISSSLPVVTWDEYVYSVSDSDVNENIELERAKEEALKYIKQNKDFVWNSSNIKRKVRMPIVNFLIENGAEVEIRYIEKPYIEWVKLNELSENPLLVSELESLIYHVEIPLLTEAYHVKYIVD